MKSKEIHKFRNISWYIRWKDSYISRPSDWTIIGVSKLWHGPKDYCYKICLFGFELNLWFNRYFVDINFSCDSSKFEKEFNELIKKTGEAEDKCVVDGLLKMIDKNG